MSQELIQYFNKQPRLGTLGTADKNGKVNVAYFGSPTMIDEKSIVMGLGKNRTFANLSENPNAVFMIMEPGESPVQWKGVRLYIRMTECETSGSKLIGIQEKIGAKVGIETAKRMIHAYVAFEILEIRPIADFGQSWKKSIGAE
ncbi:MAG: pyridoxamine 5'-phosphate oxidase family protein [Desulfatirhabdiaceae bacterium]